MPASTLYPMLTIGRARLTKGCERLPRGRRDSRKSPQGRLWKANSGRPSLIAELFAQNALFQAVAGVEQHPHRDGLVAEHLDAADVARFVVVGHRRYRAFIAIEHFDDD